MEQDLWEKDRRLADNPVIAERRTRRLIRPGMKITGAGVGDWATVSKTVPEMVRGTATGPADPAGVTVNCRVMQINDAAAYGKPDFYRGKNEHPAHRK
ncbi:MAG: hypothetical protein SCH71_01220 [Desulfobulbaceae bacterium]|nr:hypothetical protein [Desulfobulbaceae bacterium]